MHITGAISIKPSCQRVSKIYPYTIWFQDAVTCKSWRDYLKNINSMKTIPEFKVEKKNDKNVWLALCTTPTVTYIKQQTNFSPEIGYAWYAFTVAVITGSDDSKNLII